MGQVIQTVTYNKTDCKVYDNRKLVNTALSDETDQQSHHLQTDSEILASKKLRVGLENLHADNIKDEQAMQAQKNTWDNSRQPEKIIISSIFYKNEEYLCTGETLDERPSVPSSNVDELEHKESQASLDWSEKKRQFSLSKSNQSEGSFSSDVSSASRHSFSSYLHAREHDAEQILVGLGFGFEESMDIPLRFLNGNSILSPQTGSSTTYSLLKRLDTERPELDEVSSRTSFESSWSNSSFGRLPSRFTASLSRLSSVSSLISEADNNDNVLPIPSIVEPEKEQGDGFDLMRHLRLNHGQHEKGFLEPVTEELEVSSVGSGSARTKVSAQQDSFDSVGNISVVTKISVQQEESEDLKHKEIELAALISSMNSSREKLVENTTQIEVVQTGGHEVNSVDKLHLPSVNNSFVSQMTQESFELEEIATSEENLDNIEESTSTINFRGKHRLRRDHSDDSSGFEDDSGEASRKASPKTLHASLEKTSEADHAKQDQNHLLLPVEVSTPKNGAAIRLSTFAKRHSWSTSKQKRVVFEDEAYQRCRSCEDFPSGNTTCDNEFRSRSLDVPFPGSSSVSWNAFTDAQTRASSLSNPIELSSKDSSDDVADCSRNEQDKIEGDSKCENTLTCKMFFSENAAIRSLKEFMSGLLSIRSKLKHEKNPVPPKAEKLLNSTNSKEINKYSLEHSTTGSEGDSLVNSSLRKTHDQGKKTCITPSLTLTSCQNSSHHELSLFEDDLLKYRSTFIAMEVISTSQDKYYTRKLQSRFAWDILFIRRLRSHINDELNELRSNLNCTSRLPLGAQSQMKSLLRLQSGLQENLLTLASSTTHIGSKVKPSKQTLRSFREMDSIEAVENKIRNAVVEEISSMFQLRINELRDEMKAKDSLIEKLLKRLPEIEHS